MVEVTLAAYADLEWAVGLMAASEPWTTLGRSAAQCRRVMFDARHIVYIAHGHDRERLAFAVVDPQGLAGGVYLKSIAVAAGYRGRGIGSTVLRHVECQYARTGNLFLCVSSFNVRARRLYEKGLHGDRRNRQLPRGRRVRVDHAQTTSVALVAGIVTQVIVIVAIIVIEIEIVLLIVFVIVFVIVMMRSVMRMGVRHRAVPMLVRVDG